jgi:hypothetical protein
VQIDQLVSAEPGWKAVFKEPDGGESVSRVLGWAVVGEADEQEIVGVIVDPAQPARILPATEAVSPGGGSFARYRYVAPEPPPAAPALAQQATELGKSVLKRRRGG